MQILRDIGSVFTLLLVTQIVGADEAKIRIEVTGRSHQHHVPVSITVDLPKSLSNGHVVSITDEKGHEYVGQLSSGSLLSKARNEITLIVPHIDAQQTLELTATISTTDRSPYKSFVWDDQPGNFSTLRYDSKPLLRYMYEEIDNSSQERRMETYKVFHHVFAPDGQFLVTKGPGGLFPHHRGLFYGFNRISYGDGKKADIWHCRKGESQDHVSFLQSETGPVFGRHRLAIDWKGQDDQVFAKEERELTVYHISGGSLIEFASRLRTLAGPIRLDGDPQHAGFQFRASQEVPDKTKHLTYYVRPDGKGEPGSFRNWKNDDSFHANLAWNAMSFVVQDQRFTCCYLDRPQNPKPSRFSERDYGRFGSYFEYDLTEENPLELNYRIWLQKGEMDVSAVGAVHDGFIHPPEGKVH